MASIGGVACTFVHGCPLAIAPQIELFAVPGLNGQGGINYGMRGQEFTVTAVLYGTTAEVTAWIAEIQQVRADGDLVTIVPDFGTQAAGCLILDCGQPQVTPALSATTNARGAIAIRAERMG